MNKKVNISAIKHKMHFIYKDEREKNIAAIVIYNKDSKFFFDPEYKNEMTNIEVEALLLRGALVDRDGEYYRPSSFNDNNVSFGISELTEPAENDMPRLFLYDGVLPTTKDSVVMSFEYISKNKRFQGYVDIKCQGTSSMNYDKKNFTIKLFSDEALENKMKINFMNWGEQNKFCLKANWVDSTHTRNIVGARIGYDIVQSRPDSEFKRNLLTAPRCGLIDGFPIKLYYKGEFYGIYTWNIPKDAWQFAMDEDNENHIVLCAEQNSDGDVNVITSCQFKTLWTNGDEGDWSVEVGTYSNSLVEKWNRVISFVKDSSDEEFTNNFEQYFDLYSVIDYYCFSYFMTHLDGLGKNMLVVTYDGNIWGCSLYDMDSTAGAYWDSTKYVPYNYKCPEDYQEQFSLLWERIEKCFTQVLCERYFTLRKKELSLANIINHIERLYDIIPDRVFNDEQVKWTNIPQVSTNTITRVRNYLKDRAQYVDEQFNKLMNGEDYLSTATWSAGSVEGLHGDPDTDSEYAQNDVYTILYNLPVGMYTYSSTNMTWKKVSVVDETLPSWDRTLFGAHYDGSDDTNDVTFPITEPNTKTILSAFPNGITDLSELKLYRSDINASVTDMVDYNIPITSFVAPDWAMDNQPDDCLILEYNMGSLSNLTDDLPYLGTLSFGDAYTTNIINPNAIHGQTDSGIWLNTPDTVPTLSTKCFTSAFENEVYLVVAVPKSIFGDTTTDFFDYCTHNNISNAVVNKL